MKRRTASQLLIFGTPNILSNPFSILSNKNRMNVRTIPSTNEKIPIVGLGTWQTFDVGQSEAERAPLKGVLKVLIEHGGSVIDSSPMYGRSELVVGELTTELNLKPKIFEATKVWISGEDEGVEQMNASMNLMQVNQMDLFQVHNLLDWKTQLKTLRKWKEARKIRYVGITHYHIGRDAAKTILPLAKDKGIAVLINRPYEGGAVFQKVKNKTLPAWAAEFDATSWGQFFLKRLPV